MAPGQCPMPFCSRKSENRFYQNRSKRDGLPRTDSPGLFITIYDRTTLYPVPTERLSWGPMVELFKQNTPAIIALLGVVVGSLLTGGLAHWNAQAMRRRDLDLKLWERFLDRRITAHETIVAVALKMRVMVSAFEVDSCGELLRAPQVMISKEELDHWISEFAQTVLPATTWLSTSVKREIYFVQDYLATLNTKLSGVPSEHFAAVGSFVRQDFIDISDRLEKAAFEFFKAEARELRLNDLTEHHKYPLEETNRRLQNTVLLGRWKEIQVLVQSLVQPGQAPISRSFMSLLSRQKTSIRQRSRGDRSCDYRRL